MTDILRPGYKRLAAYGESEQTFKVKLDANERAENLPPRVADAVLARLREVLYNRYPADSQLRSRLAASYGVTADQVAVGNGSSEILAAACQAFGGQGRTIAFMYPSFSMYETYALLADSTVRQIAADRAFHFTPASIIAGAGDASLLLLCNPNNPSGQAMSLDDVEQIIRKVACPVIVDEAYMEFYGASAVPLLGTYDNLLVVRTFSKAYGLAGVRLGYMLGEAQLIAAVQTALLPYHVNSLSLSVADTVWQLKDEFSPAIDEMKTERAAVFAFLQGMTGVRAYPSETNFILFALRDAAVAGQVKAALADAGIGVRGFSTPELAGCLRVTVGTKAENSCFMAAMENIATAGLLRGESDA